MKHLDHLESKHPCKWPAGGRRGAQRGAAGAERGPVQVIDSRQRDTLYLSSHGSPLAGPTKKEIGFADFDPFVFGQRPATRAGAEKCEGALIGRAGPASRTQPAIEPPLSSRAAGDARRLVWV
ncbi:unnamed protein product [Danaus chrysippus]|uniref:(African queen) hypothetical protein n=1 Tax=Danaus chrysippus TaxID=151541 RepID=A0A8J2QR82_9NEOP|nr:unnamed protein product [Danaus chrysippus]